MPAGHMERLVSNRAEATTPPPAVARPVSESTHGIVIRASNNMVAVPLVASIKTCDEKVMGKKPLKLKPPK